MSFQQNCVIKIAIKLDIKLDVSYRPNKISHFDP